MVQQTLWKIKSKLPENLVLVKSMENVKIHKLTTNDVDNLPLRSIVSNICTATYEIAKYLVKILSPLSTPEFRINNAKGFVGYIKSKKFLIVTKWCHFMIHHCLQMWHWKRRFKLSREVCTKTSKSILTFLNER